MTNQLTPTDLAMIQKAQQEVLKAGAVWDFTKNHISQSYGLGPMDSVDLVTGAVTRPDEGPDEGTGAAPEPVVSPEMTD